MIPSQKSIDELKEIAKREFGVEWTDREASDAAYNLLNYYDTLMRWAGDDIKTYLRLEKEPQGFAIEGEQLITCGLCGKLSPAKECWKDKHGLKCRLCQKAVRDGIVPTSVCRNKDRWFSFETLKEKFGIHPATAKSLVRKGELKARIIPNDLGNPYFTLFLREENYEFLKIKKDVPPSALEEYDQQVAEWAENYKKNLAEGKDASK